MSEDEGNWVTVIAKKENGPGIRELLLTLGATPCFIRTFSSAWLRLLILIKGILGFTFGCV